MAGIPALPARARPAPPPAAPKCPDERPDQVSALVTARLCGKQIAVTGLTSPTTTVFANPSGTVTADVAAGPVRFNDEGRWVDIDLTLRRDADGKVRPKAHPKGLVLSGAKPAGTAALATVDAADDTLAMDWAGALEQPALDGARATYAEVKRGVDLVVEATPAGFEQFLVIKDRSAAEQARNLNLTLRSTKLRFAQDAGGVAIKDAAGQLVGRVPTPVAWDAATTGDGLHTNEKPLALTLARPEGGAGAQARTASLDPAVELRVTADQAWLDAATFPVTLDPAVTIGPVSDTYVREGESTNRAGSNDLQLGFGDKVARSFLQWDTARFAGAKIRKADLKFWNFYSGSCAAQQWELWSTDPYDTRVPMTWANQPAMRHREATSTATKGHTGSCNDNWVGVNAASFFQRAANAGAPLGYMGLRATNETTTAGWKQFRSSNASSDVVPRVSVEYDAAPIVANLSTSPATPGCVTGDRRPYLASTTPKLQAHVADADTGKVNVTFEWASAGGSVIGSQTVTGVASNTTPSVTVPAGAFADGGTYGWRVRATDGTNTSPQRAWCEFTVDTAKPGVPFVTSPLYPSVATDNTWGHGGAGQAGQFTLSPAEGTNDLVAFVYQLDTAAAQTTVNATGPTTVTVTPSEDGRRTLTVRAKDRAGHLSDPNIYTFNVGRAGLTQPRAGANVVKRTKLAVDGDASYTRVRYQYRRGPGAVEHDVPLANLTKADGSPVTYYPVRLNELGGNAVWNAVDTLGSTGGVVQVRAQVFPDADNAPGYATQWVTVNVDPDGDGADATDAGPGSVNLLTGDYQLSATDAEEFGMTAARVASSRSPADGWVPQGERLTAAQQQVTDVTGFVNDGSSTLVRSTTRGQGASTDSLEIRPTRANGDTYAVVGAAGSLSLGMRPGRRYRATAWVYVPAAVGLNFTDGRGASLVGLTRATAMQETRSAKASFVDGWQELTVDLDVPAGATQAFFRLYNGHAGGSNKSVFWDNISVREVVAPFGPQWRGGAEDGLASSEYETLTFPSPEVAKVSLLTGDHITFGRSTSGLFFPEPGAEDLSLTKVNDTTYRLAELGGGYTEFTASGGVFLPTSTRAEEEASTSRYVYDTTDKRTLLRRVVNPVEPGVGDCTAAVPAAGCEVLEYEYATVTTATGSGLGDYVDRVTRIKLWSWNPDTGKVEPAYVSAFAYDAQGRLRKVWDPRLTNALVTQYEYDAAGRVTKVTKPGELPWMFDYGAVGADPDAGRLLRARRAALKQGSRDQIDGEIATNVVYTVPLTRAAGGPHDLDAAAVARWAQHDAPTDATAVFEPESAPPGTNGATASKPGRDGYGQATVHYLNANGQEINTATPGGHVDSQTFDQHGNEVWSLESTNRALALGELPDAETRAAELGLPDNPAQRAQLLSTVTRYSPDGLDEVETLGPVIRVVLDEPLSAPGKPTLPAGAEVIARDHDTKTYDEGKPDGATYHLVTTETTGARVEGYPVDGDLRVTRYGYNAEKGGISGWTLKTATSSTADATGTPVTTYGVFDSTGRTVKEYGVGASGTDPRTRLVIYYTAGANPDDAACGGKPQWAGQPCVSRFGGAASGHDPARMSADLPVRRVTAYSRTGSEAVVVETAGGKTRTTKSFHDGVDRPTRVEITSDDGSVPAVATETEYDADSGQATVTRAGTTTVTRQFDLLGRLVSYTDADGGVTRTEYDRFDNIVKVSDNTGHATYAYDLAVDPRGELTSMTDSVAGTFTARYSPDGQLVEVTYPGGLTRRDKLDASFNPVGRTYTRDSDGEVLYAESIVENSKGQWVGHSFTGGSRQYRYDRQDRLAAVHDTVEAQCVTRTYAYDERANRRGMKSYGPGDGGACRSDGEVEVERSHSFDTADRLTDAGYRYDAFGRTVAEPGGLTLGYHVDDLVAWQQLGDARQSWTMDPSRRFRSTTTEALVGGAWQATGAKRNHYGDDSDEPRWIVENFGTGALTRNVSGPDGDLAATTSATGDVRLQLANLHGDIVLNADTALVTLEYASYDEYGVPVEGQADRRYGWLGGKQRSGDALGDTILMGVRLYSPGTGRFLSMDPVPDGSCNAYEYTCADPVNKFDLDGKWIGIVVRGGAWACKFGRSWCARSAKYVGKHAWRGIKYAGKQTWRGLRWTGRKVWGGLKWTGRKVWGGLKWTGRKISKGARWAGRKISRGYKSARSKVSRSGRWIGRNARKFWRSTGPWTWASVPGRIAAGFSCIYKWTHGAPTRGYGPAFRFAWGFVRNKYC